jgi:hypothetical protein
MDLDAGSSTRTERPDRGVASVKKRGIHFPESRRLSAREAAEPPRLTYTPGAEWGAVDAQEGVSDLAFTISHESYLSVAAFEERLGL